MEGTKCPNCDFLNPPEMKFCGNCGKPLVEQEKSGERKIITILFADIAGFTTISETMDPEMVQDLLNTVFENISNSIRKYGGTVHKYIGDEVMALFGAPIAYENHAERAGRAAIEIEQSIEDITEKIHLSLNLHIALHSGEVVLGKVGSGDVQDYTVIGDTVNVASRLENIAPENNILVSREFYERTKHAFQFEPFGETKVKGKAKPITCYLLRTVRTQREKIRGIKELETPLLGRDREIGFLLNKLEETKNEKSMHLVVLKGQPGIGKSRLFHEFEEQLNVEETLFFETRSLPFGQEELHPFKQFVRDITSITTDMDEDKAKKSVENSFNNLLGTADLGVLDLIDIILDFTSVKEVNLEPKRKHQIVYYMIENLLKKLSEQKTLVLGFAHINFGRIYLKKGDSNKALNYYNDAVSIFEELKSNSMLMETYNRLSWFYFEMKNIEKATEYTGKINEYLEHTENLELQASAKRLMGNMQIEQENYENAEQMLMEAFIIYKKMSNTEELVSLYSDFIALFMKKGDENKISEYKKRGKQIVEEILEGIENEGMKCSFLKKKDVRKVLDL